MGKSYIKRFFQSTEKSCQMLFSFTLRENTVRVGGECKQVRPPAGIPIPPVRCEERGIAMKKDTKEAPEIAADAPEIAADAPEIAEKMDSGVGRNDEGEPSETSEATRVRLAQKK